MTEKKVRFSNVNEESIETTDSLEDNISESSSDISAEKHVSTYSNEKFNKRNFIESICYRFRAAVNAWNNPDKIEELNFCINELQRQNVNLFIYIQRYNEEDKKNCNILIEKTQELEKNYLELNRINEENSLLKENLKKANEKFLHAKKLFKEKKDNQLSILFDLDNFESELFPSSSN